MATALSDNLIGIVGVTGAVGQELLDLLLARGVPADRVRLYASARSAGKSVERPESTWTVEEATLEAMQTCDIAFLSVGSDFSREVARDLAETGTLVIDNSSAFRMDPAVPLVVPEINGEAALDHRGLIANPNCSTAILLMGLYPLHRQFGVKRLIACTYQAVSGAGAGGMTELEDQTRAWANEAAPPQPDTFPHPIAFNLLPQCDVFLENGYTKEEEKMVNESRKIMSLPELGVSVTCVRVPVLRAHSIAVHAAFERPVDLDAARQAIGRFVGAELKDEPAEQVYPMPIDYTRHEACGVGRLRRDTVFENGLAFFVVGDQLWKGAALNAIQIAEYVAAKGAVRV
ncbi:MAG: aspartate-semialdehyde dehydrogenase [Opitutales bacterium]